MENKLISGPIHQLDAQRSYFNFLTHVKLAAQAGLRWPVDTVSEFGVGSSLGIAFCSLLAGAKRFHGFDAVAHLNPSAQFDLLTELRELFIARAPAINNYGIIAFEFPGCVISDDVIENATSNTRINDIRNAIDRLGDLELSNIISYDAPYKISPRPTHIESTDFLLSTATLEHIDEVGGIYNLFYEMLTPNGLMSHSIDFKSHGFSKQRNGKRNWNSHWLISEDEWRSITQNYDYSINRLPCSDHLKLIIKARFKILLAKKRMQDNELNWKDLALRWQWMTLEDLSCSGLHVVASKIIY